MALAPTTTWEDCLNHDAHYFRCCRVERHPKDGKYRVFAISCFLYPLAAFASYADARDYAEAYHV